MKAPLQARLDRLARKICPTPTRRQGCVELPEEDCTSRAAIVVATRRLGARSVFILRREGRLERLRIRQPTTHGTVPNFVMATEPMTVEERRLAIARVVEMLDQAQT